MVDLPLPGGAGDEHEAAREVAEALQLLAESELFDRDDLRRDDAEDRAGAVVVAERVAAEARDAGDLVGEVGVVELLVLLPVPLRHDRADHQLEPVVARAAGWSVEPLHLAVAANDRRLADAQMEVAAALRC